MKRIILLTAVVAFLGFSCSLTKENKLYRSTLNGTWKLTEVNYGGAEGKFSSVLFKDADAACFQGSTWTFNANNSVGSYTIAQGQDCVAGQRNFRWSVYEGSGLQQLQFKFVDEKRKDINNYGFRLNIDYLGDATMKLRSNVNVEGEPINVIYQFEKIND